MITINDLIYMVNSNLYGRAVYGHRFRLLTPICIYVRLNNRPTGELEASRGML